MNRFKKQYPKQDDLTKEWLFNGKWHDTYPTKEVEDWNDRYDEYMERKLDEKREESLPNQNRLVPRSAR